MKAHRERPAISAPFAWESLPNSYHFTHAAKRSSAANWAGDWRSVEKAVSGRSRMICMRKPEEAGGGGGAEAGVSEDGGRKGAGRGGEAGASEAGGVEWGAQAGSIRTGSKFCGSPGCSHLFLIN